MYDRIIEMKESLIENSERRGYMKTQCHNPYLPLFEHIPDGEPKVFGDRLYIFGSHDLENGNEFCELYYVAWSAPVNDLSDWRYEGVIYRKDQDPFNQDLLPLYAPDVVKGRDGRYYLYYCVRFQDSINVAVCDTPAGEYEYYGRIRYQDGTVMTDNQPYDPSVICCEEGNFLYFGLAAATIGTLMLLSRLLDGISDLVMGSIIDRTHTRWGKARPWILFSAIPMGLGLVLMFSIPQTLPYMGKLIFACVTYVLMAAVIYTACNLSYNTLLALEAPNPKDRVTMSSLRFFLTMATVLFINYNCGKFVDKFGWTGMSLIFGGIAILLLLITFFGTKERANIAQNTAAEVKPENKMSVKESFSHLFKNKYFWLLTVIFVLNYTILGVNNGLRIYFARNVLGNAALMGTLTLCFILPKMIGNLVYPYINKFLGKWKSMMLGYVIELAGVLVMALSPAGFATAAAGLILLGIGGIPHNAGLFAMVADVIDYGEWKTGVRLDGLTNSATSFGMKVGAGLGSAITGWGLAWAAYDGKLAVQTAETIFGIKMVYTIVPAVLIVIGLIVLYFCNLDKIYPQIEEGLAKKHAAE